MATLWRVFATMSCQQRQGGRAGAVGLADSASRCEARFHVQHSQRVDPVPCGQFWLQVGRVVATHESVLLELGCSPAETPLCNVRSANPLSREIGSLSGVLAITVRHYEPRGAPPREIKHWSSKQMASHDHCGPG